MSRQIEALEKSLSLSLFTRSSVGLHPTDAALRLRPHLEALNNAADALLRDAQLDDDVSGVVRITTNEIIGNEILPKALLGVRSLYPKMRFEIIITNEIQNLLAREADIAIRTGVPDQDGLVRKKIAMMEIGLHASETYMRKKIIPEFPEDLSNYDLIGYDQENEAIRNFKKHIGTFDRSNFTYMANSPIMYSRLVDAGCGIGFCRVDTKRKDRIRILANHYNLRSEVWIAMHENLRASQKYRLIFRTLGEEIKRQF
jgi:DNA-binding transcriptional LysR family regulator